jgi:hypothetical protein
MPPRPRLPHSHQLGEITYRANVARGLLVLSVRHEVGAIQPVQVRPE